MNYKGKPFKELIEIIDGASCELYDRVTKVSSNSSESVEEVFNNIWQSLVVIGDMDRVKGEEE